VNPIRILVVDDSLLMRRVLSDLLQSDPRISVVGTANDGEDAIAKVSALNPDVVTMDVEMPKMNGLTALRKIMEIHPVPVIMVSSLTQREAALTLRALEIGAVDYMPKPNGPTSLNMDSVKNELLEKVKNAVSANMQLNTNLVESMEHEKRPHGLCDKVISIAASTGGPSALTKVLSHLPRDMPPILVVQHMPIGMTKWFAAGLANECKFRVKEAEEGDFVQAGLALIAPGGFHMVVTKTGKITLNQDPPINYVRPAADVSMISAAHTFGSKNIGVVLTGMGSDGAMGIKAIKENGGKTIAQDEKTSVIFGMPNEATKTGCVDIVAALERIPKEIINACEK